jgi:Domain of unknown function (DUF4184)
MPFTLAHPAAVVPLAKPLNRFAVMSALVIGSCMPDLPHFVPMGITRTQSHSLPALFWFSLPVGLVVFWVYHCFLKQPLLALAPSGLRRRLPPSLISRPRAPLSDVLLSLLIGAATHFLWDSFTHYDGFAVAQIRWLDTTLAQVAGHKLHIYHVLQYGSSALGVGLLLFWTARWYLRAPEYTLGYQPAPLLFSVMGYLLIAIIPCTVAIFHGLSAIDFVAWLQGARVSAGPSISSGAKVALVGLVIYSACYQVFVTAFVDTGRYENR